jgi:predicted TIM-barrel fold metal-dependent hydrolase
MSKDRMKEARSNMKKIDMHFHVVGRGQDLNQVDENVFFYPEDNNTYFTKVLYRLVEKYLGEEGADFDQSGTVDTNEYLTLIYKHLSTSKEIDGVVLLGLDALYDPESGELDKRRTDLWVSNRFLAKKVNELNDQLMREDDPQKREKKFYWGASVSPNRNDWEEEMEFVLNDPYAVLMKLIPSVQHLDLRDPKHKDYYESLARNKMPLLCHVGPEYSFPEGIREKERDNFRFLDKPLECGVTVIAAHCATPVFPIDKNETAEFGSFMKSANSGGRIQLWGDTSAFSLLTRIPILEEIIETFPPEWLVHGSDFPIPIEGWVHLPGLTHDVTWAEYKQIKNTANLLDKDVMIKRAHGFSDSILENADKVLRLPRG